MMSYNGTGSILLFFLMYNINKTNERAISKIIGQKKEMQTILNVLDEAILIECNGNVDFTNQLYQNIFNYKNDSNLQSKQSGKIGIKDCFSKCLNKKNKS